METKTVLSIEELKEFELLKLYYNMQWNIWNDATTDEEMTKAIYEVRKTRKRLDEIRLKVIDLLPEAIFDKEKKELLRSTLKNITQVKKLDNIILNSWKKKN